MQSVRWRGWAQALGMAAAKMSQCMAIVTGRLAYKVSDRVSFYPNGGVVTVAQTTRSGRLVKYKRAVASIAPGLVVAVLAGAPQAQAADECGPDGPGADIVPCGGGAFPTAITYEDSDGLTLVLDDPTTVVVGDSGSSAVLVESDTTTTNSVVIIARQLDTVTASDDDVSGLLARNQGLGAATVEIESGMIRTTDSTGFASSAVSAWVINPDNTEDASIIVRGGRLGTQGEFSAGTATIQSGMGNAITTVTGGTIQTSGEYSPGVYAIAFRADSTASVDIRISDGSISTTADGDSFGGIHPHAVFGLVGTLGDASVLIEG